MPENRGFFLVLSFVTVLGFSAEAWAGDGVVALQAADPSCADDSGNFYVDCGNGTVTDNRTGLVWLRKANCLGEKVDWYTAMDIVDGLNGGLNFPSRCNPGDGSAPGEWRLPSIYEWHQMVADAAGCNPAITTDSGSGCMVLCVFTGATCSFTDVQSGTYHAADTDYDNLSTPRAWAVKLDTGELIPRSKSEVAYVWPVRGGQ